MSSVVLDVLLVCVNLGPKTAISRGEQNRYGCRQRTLLTARLIKFYGGLRGRLRALHTMTLFRFQIWGFSITPGSKKTDPGRLRQRPTTRNGNIDVFGRQSYLPLLVVDRFGNNLATFLCGSSSSKIPNLALKIWRYLSQFQRCDKNSNA